MKPLQPLGSGAGGGVCQLNVRQKAGAQNLPFQHIVAEDLVLGEPLGKKVEKGIHPENSLTAEDGLAKQILVPIPADQVVGGHPSPALHQTGKPGLPLHAGDHPGGEDAVALGHPPQGLVHLRPVKGMDRRGDHPLGRAEEELGVAVQGDD